MRHKLGGHEGVPHLCDIARNDSGFLLPLKALSDLEILAKYTNSSDWNCVWVR